MSTSAPPSFISSRIVCRIVDAAAARGIDAGELCRDAGIAMDQVRDIDAQIDVGPYLRLWRLIGERIPDPGFAIGVARGWSTTHNLLRFICMSSANLGEALESASRYLRVVTNVVSWPLERTADGAVLAMVRAGHAEGPEVRLAEEFGVAEVVCLARAFTGDHGHSAPTLVRFGFDAPADPAALAVCRTFFEAPLEFSAPRTEIHFAARALELPLVKADPAMVAFFEPYVEKLLREGRDGPDARAHSIVDDVDRVLGEELRGKAPTLEDVAARLETSGRTLRRHLQQAGTSYQRLLDDARFRLAKHHLDERREPISAIAFLLGFSEPSAFHRAFRRWSGMSPHAYARTRPVAIPRG